jgi:hypothetical protein
MVMSWAAGVSIHQAAVVAVLQCSSNCVSVVGKLVAQMQASMHSWAAHSWLYICCTGINGAVLERQVPGVEQWGRLVDGTAGQQLRLFLRQAEVQPRCSAAAALQRSSICRKGHVVRRLVMACPASTHSWAAAEVVFASGSSAAGLRRSSNCRRVHVVCRLVDRMLNTMHSWAAAHQL